jgi:hypothetical protein
MLPMTAEQRAAFFAEMAAEHPAEELDAPDPLRRILIDGAAHLSHAEAAAQLAEFGGDDFAASIGLGSVRRRTDGAPILIDGNPSRGEEDGFCPPFAHARCRRARRRRSSGTSSSNGHPCRSTVSLRGLKTGWDGKHFLLAAKEAS